MDEKQTTPQVVTPEPVPQVLENIWTKISTWIWAYAGLATLAVILLIVILFSNQKKPVTPAQSVITFTNTVVTTKIKYNYVDLYRTNMILLTNIGGKIDTNVMVVLSKPEYTNLIQQVSDASNYYADKILANMSNQNKDLTLTHYKTTTVYRIPEDLAVNIWSGEKYNVVGLGYSICGRIMGSYDRINIFEWEKFGLGAGAWGTYNAYEPARRWDFGVKISGDF